MSQNSGQRDKPTIAVVIPTLAGSTLKRAVESVVHQTYPVSEIIVVADTHENVALPNDERIRVLRTGPRAGANVARNAGVQAAMSDFVAFLDDDDTWAPSKLEKQLAAARVAEGTNRRRLLMTSLIRVVSPNGREVGVFPNTPLSAAPSIGEYVTRKTTFRGGPRLVQTSTIVCSRHVAIEHPFIETTSFHQDLEWVIGLDRCSDLELYQVREPLVDYHVTPGSITSKITPGGSMAWGERSLQRLSPRARGDWFLTTPVHYARQKNDVVGCVKAIKLGFSKGRPGIQASVSAGSSLALIVARAVRARSRQLKGSS